MSVELNKDMNASREALESIRKDANDPTLSVGDIVFSGGVYAAVIEIKTYAPGAHSDSPIRNDWTAVKVVTDMGRARWHGREPETANPFLCPQCGQLAVKNFNTNPTTRKRSFWASDTQDVECENCAAALTRNAAYASDDRGWKPRGA